MEQRRKRAWWLSRCQNTSWPQIDEDQRELEDWRHYHQRRYGKRGVYEGLGNSVFRCPAALALGIAGGSGAEALFLRLLLLVCVTKEPPSINTEPMPCSTLNFSCSIATASSIAKATWSWTTGAARLTPMSWLDL